MTALSQTVQQHVAAAFKECGIDPKYGSVVKSRHGGGLGQFQCNGALEAAAQQGAQPRHMAERIVTSLSGNLIFADVSVAGPGFINLNITDAFLVEYLTLMNVDKDFGCDKTSKPLTVIIDFGGPNVAKPMHVGHLRSSIIGESLKRLFRFFGHSVIGDVHLGDWGTQMGMIILELQRREPMLPYFDAHNEGPYPIESPITFDELEEMYPTASKLCKDDQELMNAARQATVELQHGRPGYRALWQHFVGISQSALKSDFETLGVTFDLWLGESSVHERIPLLIESLKRSGMAHESAGALIIPVSEPTDTRDLPPMMLMKSDGAVLYSTTDLATIEHRCKELQADLILYVVDARQSDHFEQVFRAAYKTGVAPRSVGLEHIAFGTVNGIDGKPFKTRAGGVMRLGDLIHLITDKAQQRMEESELGSSYGADERQQIARMAGLAALKYGDLKNNRLRDYIFDLERFSRFEGDTGPYLQYSTVRAKSILRKTQSLGYEMKDLLGPTMKSEKELMLQLAQFEDSLVAAFDARSPHLLCEYAYKTATLFNRFYKDCHVLTESNVDQRGSWMSLTHLYSRALTCTLMLLGIDVPEKM